MSKKIALVELDCGRPELNEAIGICTIASYIQQENSLSDSDILLFSERIPEKSFINQPIDKYCLIGISAQLYTLDSLKKIYSYIREKSENVTIVIGNLLAIYGRETLLRLFPDVILCLGEGEIPFSELAKLQIEQSGENKVELAKIPGIMFLDGEQIIETEAVLVDVRKLPPPRRDFVQSIIERQGITRIEASRGCHWGRCEFCSVSSRFGLGGYRTFDHLRVLDDLKLLCRLGAKAPYFSDEDFFGKQYDHSIRLAKSIVHLKNMGDLPWDLNFFISILSSDVKHPKGRLALEEWKKAGLREVFIGVESGSEDEVRRFAKKANVSTNTSAIEYLLSAGFQVDIGFIMFDPGMKFQELSYNISWLINQPLDTIDSRLTKKLRIQPQTGLMNSYAKYVSGEMNLNSLDFPYEFEDQKVGEIFRDFEEFESLLKTNTYSSLASARGELHDEQERLRRKRKLSELRRIDLEILKLMVSDVDKNEVRLAKKNALKKQSEILESLKFQLSV